MSLTNCRFYEDKYPDVDSFVMVNVRQVRRTTAPVNKWGDSQTFHAFETLAHGRYPVSTIELTSASLDCRDGCLRQAPRIR